jgi:hypothetical protein
VVVVAVAVAVLVVIIISQVLVAAPMLDMVDLPQVVAEVLLPIVLQQQEMAVMVTPAHLHLHQQYMVAVVDAALAQAVMLKALEALEVVVEALLKQWQV